MGRVERAERDGSESESESESESGKEGVVSLSGLWAIERVNKNERDKGASPMSVVRTSAHEMRVSSLVTRQHS
jgi:hypothetical protein